MIRYKIIPPNMSGGSPVKAVPHGFFFVIHYIPTAVPMQDVPPFRLHKQKTAFGRSSRASTIPNCRADFSLSFGKPLL
jgi:hypothetical protein